MATVDAVDQDENEDDQVTLSPEALEESLKATEVTDDTTTDDDDVPDKYKGKSVKEVISMHQQAETVIGRHSSEVGELRGLVDGFISKQTTDATKAATVPDEKPDFFEDPDAAVSNAIANHPDVLAARDSANRMAQQTAASQLKDKHPDATEIVGDPAFAEFVKASPIRSELFQRADKQNDFAAADELLSTFKSRQGVIKQTAENEKATRSAQLKTASTGGASGAQAGTGKKIYRRADIIRLMRDKPDRYEALSGEIQLAYTEGRVR
jgi:hypothetical protein